MGTGTKVGWHSRCSVEAANKIIENSHGAMTFTPKKHHQMRSITPQHGQARPNSPRSAYQKGGVTRLRILILAHWQPRPGVSRVKVKGRSEG